MSRFWIVTLLPVMRSVCDPESHAAPLGSDVVAAGCRVPDGPVLSWSG
jgi:hypothetical protein